MVGADSVRYRNGNLFPTRFTMETIKVKCTACMEMVTPKAVTVTARRGVIMSFVKTEYNCPKCGMERIWDPPEKKR